MEIGVPNPTDPSAVTDAALLEIWAEKHRTPGLTADKCTAAEARALHEIYRRKLYRSLKLSWSQYLCRHAGIACHTAQQIFARLNQFGDSYFDLCTILNLSHIEHRVLAPLVQDNHVHYQGRRIAITPENRKQLAEAYQALRPKLKIPAPRGSLAHLSHRLDQSMGQIASAIRRGLNEKDRETLLKIMDDTTSKLQGLYRYF